MSEYSQKPTRLLYMGIFASDMLWIECVAEYYAEIVDMCDTLMKKNQQLVL